MDIYHEDIIWKKEMQDQKELEKLFRKRDERLKARAKRSLVYTDPCFLNFINYYDFINKVHLYCLSA